MAQVMKGLVNIHEFDPNDAFFRTDPLLYHKVENMVIFRPGNLYSLCNPGNQDYQKIIQAARNGNLITKI